MNTEKTFDATELLAELDGGVLNEKLSTALREVAEGAMTNERQGKVAIEFTLKRIGDSAQIAMSHKLTYVRPTKRGKSSEEDTTSTPLYVGQRGRLSIMPDTQQGFGFDKAGEGQTEQS